MTCYLFHFDTDINISLEYPQIVYVGLYEKSTSNNDTAAIMDWGVSQMKNPHCTVKIIRIVVLMDICGTYIIETGQRFAEKQFS